MTCALPPPAWWHDYLAGRLTTPQQIYAASLAEYNGQATPERAFFGYDLDPGLGWDAPAKLQAPSHFRTTAWLRQCERADWAHVDSRLAVWSAVFIEMARKRNIPLYVHSALRDKLVQDAHYKRGTSKVRYPHSAHNIGEAVDVVHGTLHWEMNRQEWALLGVLGKLALERLNAKLPKDRKLTLIWGGDWRSFWDPAHWEIADYKARTRELSSVQPVRMTPRYILRNVPP